MGWSWTADVSEWTIPSLRGHTPPPRASTWDDPHMGEEDRVRPEAAPEIMIVVTIEDTNAMMTENTANLTGAGLHHPTTTAEGTGHALGRGRTPHDVTEESSGWMDGRADGWRDFVFILINAEKLWKDLFCFSINVWFELLYFKRFDILLRL